jgi:hypothetical protein
MSNPYTKTIKLDLALPLDREIAEIIELLEAIKDCTNKITAHVKKIETIRVTQIVEREFDEHFIDSDENP